MNQLVNTQYFREDALFFQKHKRYTLAPPGSKDWWEYWEERERRCLYGYQVGDMRITGRHYFYLNFQRIQRTLGKGKVEFKEPMFPAFWEIDYNWFWYKEIAWWGCTHEQLEALRLWRNPTYIGGARHLSCLKTRRAGFSYKEASDGVYNFNFFPGSKSYYLADTEDYLTKDGILNKVQPNLDWLNAQTDGFWLKNRQKNFSLMHQKASYIDNNDKLEKGFLSEIMGVTVAGDPEKARGKDGMKITFEEAGSFKNLKQALGIVVPSVRAGASITGQISVFGTGGEEKGQDIEGLDEIFNDPTTYDMLPFVNDWEDFEATECGVFVPCYMTNPTFIDDQGVIDLEGAIKYDDEQREKKRKAKDVKELDRHMAENPRTPTEALIRVNVNNFPIAEAKYQRQRVKNDKDIQGLIQHGEFVSETSGVEFRPKDRVDAKPVDYYPHRKEHAIEGCVTRVKPPEKDATGKIPDNLYIINVDPFYDDEAEDVTSLGIGYVTKRVNNQTPTHAFDVCWFAGRPSLPVFHETLVKMAEYYNAKIQSEIAGGGKGLYDYCRQKKKLHLLEFTPIEINNKEIKKEATNRTYFMTMSTDDKRMGLTYYQDYLRETVCLDANGVELKNIHFVYDLALLDEIIKFNPNRNADRISAQIIKMFMLKEKSHLEVKKATKKSKLVDRGLFGSTGKSNDWGTFVLQDGEVIMK